MIEKLDNNEQVLLMYLADELPAEDRQEVRQLLDVDPSLRQEFEELRAGYDSMNEYLARLDDLSPAAINVDFAARQIGREIRQRLARPKIVPAAPLVERPVRSWRWLYPTVAAASIAMVAMIWLGRQATPGNPYGPSNLPRMNPVASADRQPSEQPQQQSDPSVALLIQSLQPADDESKQVAVADGMPQDDVSQLLLDASAAVK